MARSDKASRDAGVAVHGLVRRFKDVEAVRRLCTILSVGAVETEARTGLARAEGAG